MKRKEISQEKREIKKTNFKVLKNIKTVSLECGFNSV